MAQKLQLAPQPPPLPRLDFDFCCYNLWLYKGTIILWRFMLYFSQVLDRRVLTPKAFAIFITVTVEMIII